ncbi:hypothetical protein H920_10940 [Fukomys damarensis]|uniref:Uncharacterized protein n=1 Tax=Fukomys damarensis TaxID=885580 RepID=A0A091DB31_FUKDA|nr:hypothetical protein H920_10940 [Fukomys damarensis]
MLMVKIRASLMKAAAVPSDSETPSSSSSENSPVPIRKTNHSKLLLENQQAKIFPFSSFYDCWTTEAWVTEGQETLTVDPSNGIRHVFSSENNTKATQELGGIVARNLTSGLECDCNARLDLRAGKRVNLEKEEEEKKDEDEEVGEFLPGPIMHILPNVVLICHTFTPTGSSLHLTLSPARQAPTPTSH